MEPENWSSNSPDLNHVDYSIWEALQQFVYHRSIQDVERLKEVRQTCWEQIGQYLIIDRTIEQFRKRLSLTVEDT